MSHFQDYDFPNEVMKGLKRLGFSRPTPIQQKVIPVALGRRDLMVSAETGSGKTAAYGLPLVNQLLKDKNSKGLIIAPTRELVQQIAEFLNQLTASCPQLKVTRLMGGTDIRKQFGALKKKPRLIVATPGRLIDHLDRGTLQLKHFNELVLDEGDRMLDMGFAPQLKVILKHLPAKRKTTLYSATLPPQVQKLAQAYLKKPQLIEVGRTSRPVAAIRQSSIEISPKEKGERVLDEVVHRKGSIIIFAKTQRRTEALARNLREYGCPVDFIHGGRTQGQRNKALRNFKNGNTRILCATDVAARGLDIPRVEHVINYDLPMVKEDYVHRVGRTARNGCTGEAISFVTPAEHKVWRRLSKEYKVPGPTN